MGIPEPGSRKYNEMVEFMRADLAANMGYSKLIEAAQKSLESQGKNFQEEYKKWKRKGGDKVRKCAVCGNKVDWDLIKEEFSDVLTQADQWGVESLTEAKQMVYLGKCCSVNCYLELV